MNKDHTNHPPADGLLLSGIDGTNPLGFLSALGVLRTLDIQDEQNPVKMQWESSDVSWRPRVFSKASNIEELLESLKAGLEKADSSIWTLDKRLPFKAEKFRQAVVEAVEESSKHSRDRIDMLAALGVDSLTDKNGVFKDTSLRMVRAGDSAGNGLLAYGKRILDETKASDLRAATTESWTYQDEGCALRWDPEEHHGYALQWTNPSKEHTVSVRGANRLALEAMPLLPTMPNGSRIETTGFGRVEGKREYFTWPIWGVPIGLGTVKSLLALADLQNTKPDYRDFSSRGIISIYRCERVMTSKYYRNFTPAQCIYQGDTSPIHKTNFSQADGDF